MSKHSKALKLALEALEIGHEYAVETAENFHIEMAGYKQQRHDAMDAEVKQIADAITAIREALSEQPATKAGELGAMKAEFWKQPAQQQDGETIVQTFTGLPKRKLRDLLAAGWQINGVCFQRTEENGTVRRGAATTGGMVLWWNQPAQQQEQVIAWITNGSLYGLRRTNKKTAVIHREETKVARIPVFIKVDA